MITSTPFGYGVTNLFIGPIQCKMARAATDMGVRELADAAKVSPNTVTRFERGEKLQERTVEAIQRALEAAGVRFTDDGCVCPPLEASR